jgi:hypothetical protein
MIRQIAPQFFTLDIPGTLAYYDAKLGFQVFRHVAGPAGLRHRCARPAGDSLPLCRTSHSNPNKYSDELLDAYVRTTRLSKMESRSFVCCRRNLLGCRKINAVRSVLVK